MCKWSKELNLAVLNLWPSRTLKEVLENPLFYEQPITQPPTMTSHQFLESLKCMSVPQEIIENISLVNVVAISIHLLFNA